MRVGANRPRSFLLPNPVMAMKSGLEQNLDDKRYISETGQEQRIAAIVAPVARDLGFFLVRVKILPDNGCTLQIMAEDENGSFTIAQCQELSQELSPVLDVEEPIETAYHLEVSSPGIDRPLVRVRDFMRNLGHEARIELKDMIEGRRRFRGMIRDVDDHAVTLTLPDVPHGADADVALPLERIAQARLVMTERLLAEAARRQRDDRTLDDPEIQTVKDDAPGFTDAGSADTKTNDRS